MGDHVLSQDAFTGVHHAATGGGTRSATSHAEERVSRGEGLDPLVDPKGLAHLGPIRRSLPRFVQQSNGLWMLTIGVPMAVETLLDTTGSMGNNVDVALERLIEDYLTLTGGKTPVFGRYDVQIATAIFGDIQDVVRRPGSPILCRSQFEMAVEIARQLTLMVPGKNGCANGKEDPQYGLFGAAYLTAARINAYGLKSYHFTVSDEPTGTTIDFGWLKRIFGDSVLESVTENGFSMTKGSLPDTARVVKDLQTRAHAFFLQVEDRSDVTHQWQGLYGKDHCIMLPNDTSSLHLVKSVIIGLTEGVLDLSNAREFLREHGADSSTAKSIVRAVSGIPLRAQMEAPSFALLPKAGDLFQSKADLWPMTAEELVAFAAGEGAGAEGEKKGEKPKQTIEWL